MSLLFPTSFNTVVPHVNNISAVCFWNSNKIFVVSFFLKNTCRVVHSEHLNVILVLVACCFKTVYSKLLFLVCFTFIKGMCDSLVFVPNTSPKFEQWPSLDPWGVGSCRWWMCSKISFSNRGSKHTVHSDEPHFFIDTK